jgi:hypothetical protein
MADGRIIKVTTYSGHKPSMTIYVVGNSNIEEAIKMIADLYPVGTAIEDMGRASNELLSALKIESESYRQTYPAKS